MLFIQTAIDRVLRWQKTDSERAYWYKRSRDAEAREKQMIFEFALERERHARESERFMIERDAARAQAKEMVREITKLHAEIEELTNPPAPHASASDPPERSAPLAGETQAGALMSSLTIAPSAPADLSDSQLAPVRGQAAGGQSDSPSEARPPADFPNEMLFRRGGA